MERFVACEEWGGPWCSKTHAVMALLILWIIVPLGVVLQTVQVEPQELEFVVLNTSVAKEQNKERLISRNSFALVGTNMRMICRYRVSSDGRDYCAEKNRTNLVVYPGGKVSRTKGDEVRDKLVVIDDTNKCNITVEFKNVTVDIEGPYVCEDKEASLSDMRIIEIGEAPVEPSNISVVYRPLKSITLNLDPVKTGRDLSDPGTVWTVEYMWKRKKSYKVCHKRSRRCNSLQHGLCQPCVIRLRNYAGCGQYTGLGILINDITFRISVSNYFGNVSVERTFNLLNWVQPSALELSIGGKTNSSLEVVARPPKELDENHYHLVKAYEHPMTLRWSVDLVSAREQVLLLREGSLFEKEYGFVRNLEDDLASLDPSVMAAFPRSSKELPWELNIWNQCKEPPPNQSLLIDDLPFPGYYYSVSVQSLARYAGEKMQLDVSLAYTQEAAPQEGPELHENFAYCSHNSINAKACAYCVLYFREIPRSKRGSADVKYNITLILLNGDRLPLQRERCTLDTTRSAAAHGQDNSVLVHDLEAGGEYHISLVAYNAVGSKASTRILHVHATSPPMALRNIVLEKMHSSSLWMYDLYWDPQQIGHQKQMRYFVHHCNATFLQTRGRTNGNNNSEQSLEAAEKPLKCVTNMVNQQVTDTSKFSFNQQPRKGGLTAAFFVSMVTADGLSSGLQKVGCFYTRNRYPEKLKDLWVRKMSNNARALRVVFSMPCGPDLNYQYGRPEYYAIGVVKLGVSHDSFSFCKQQCGRLMQETKYETVALLPEDNLQESVRIDQHDLEPDTMYCVGVNLAERSMQFRESEWQCSAAVTEELPDDRTLMIALSIMGMIVVVVAIISLIVCWKHAKKQKAKFRRELKPCDSGSPPLQLWDDKTSSPNDQIPEAVELNLQAVGNPIHSVEIYADPVASADESDTESSVPFRNDADRYAPVDVGDGLYPGLLPAHVPCGVHICDDTDQSSINGASGHSGSLQRSRLTGRPTRPDFPASPVERRPLLRGDDADGDSDRESSSSVGADGEAEQDGENSCSFNPETCPEQPQNMDTLSAVNSSASKLNCSQPSCSLLRSGDLSHIQPDAPILPESQNKISDLQVAQSPACTASMQCSAAESQTSGLGHSDNEGAVSLEASMIGQYSIDDILRAAGNSPSMATQPFRMAEFEAAEPSDSDSLQLEDIHRAANMCPWNDHAELRPDRGAGAPNHSGCDARRDSACFVGCDSSIGTESAKETDGESESLTGNS